MKTVMLVGKRGPAFEAACGCKRISVQTAIDNEIVSAEGLIENGRAENHPVVYYVGFNICMRRVNLLTGGEGF